MSQLSGVIFFPALLGWALIALMLNRRLNASGALLTAAGGMLFTAYTGCILLEWMRPTAYAVIYGGLACLPVGLWAIVKDHRGLRRRILTPGMLLYLSGCAAFALITIGFHTDSHDTYSYWMRIVRELYMFDRFPIHADTNMYHSDYIPFFAALQYCVTRVAGWQEISLSYVTFGCVLISVAVIADALRLKGVSSRRAFLTSLVLAGAVIYAYPLFRGFRFDDIRGDGPMCMLFTAGLIELITREREASLWPTALTAVILTGTKIYTGVLFALALAFSLLFQGRTSAPGTRGKRRWTAFWLALAGIAFIWFSWSIKYHYTTAAAEYEVRQFLGLDADSAPTFGLSTLLSGNPRTAEFMSGLSDEVLSNLRSQIGQALSLAAQSKLPWTLLLIGLTVVIACCGRHRQGLWSALAVLGAVSAAYTLGLAAAFLVQSETVNGTVVYLADIALPFVLLALFAAARESDTLPGLIAFPAAMLTLFLFLTPGKWLYSNVTAISRALPAEAELSQAFFAQENIGGVLTPADGNQHALLIECSREAARLSSPSFKTHTYQYYALPVRAHVYQFTYGKDDVNLQVDDAYMRKAFYETRCSLMILNVEDEAFWQRLLEILPFADGAEPIGVYDVKRQDGSVTALVLRGT